MTTPSDIKAVLAHILDLIANDAAVQAIVGIPARVYLHVPEVPQAPFILGRFTSIIDTSYMGDTAQDATLSLTYWNDESGDAKLYDIWQAVYAVINRLCNITVGGARITLITHQSMQFLTDADGLSYYANDSYKVIIS